MALSDIDDNIIIGLIVAWNIFLIGSSYLFYHLKDNLTIKFRNVPLTLLGVISTMLVSNTYFITILAPATVPCYFVLWVLSLGAPTWFLTFFGKYFLLAFSYQHAKSKLKANSNQLNSIQFLESRSAQSNIPLNKKNVQPNSLGLFEEEESTSPFKSKGEVSVELGRSWYHQNRNRWTTQSVCVCIIVILGFHAVVAALTQWLDPNYHKLAKPQLNCIQGNGMIPLFVTAILYFGVGGPFLVILLWPAKDAYWLKMELLSLVLSTSPPIALFLIFTYIQSLQEKFYPVVFLFGFHFLSHCSSILLPVVDVYRNEAKKTPNNYLKFQQMLLDPDQFVDFKEFTVSDFTIENPLFYEAYMNFLNRYEPILVEPSLELSNQPSKAIKKVTSSFLPNLFTNKWNKLNNDLNQQDKSIPLQDLTPNSSTTLTPSTLYPNLILLDQENLTTTIELRPLKGNEIRELMHLYEQYIAPGSDYQLNLTGLTVRRIRTMINEQRFHPLMLLPALNEVLDSMYRNTYVRFIKFQQF